ncbi:hypothetical protein C0989_012429 [Termitomyces sp. Mn162]|nr:hypothetical protein C0989_012429 [Termitomyces sp. Mn162]
MPKQTTYDGYKALVTQVDQHYWEDQSKNMALQTSWNTSSNTNWQARAINSTQSLIPINPTNSAPCFPLAQGLSSTIQPLEQCPPAQLNAADLYKAPEPLNTNPDNLNNVPDSANNQEALCMNKIRDRPWIDILEETQERQWKDGLEDALDHGPDPNVFSALAILLCAMVLVPDNLLAHLPSHSSITLLLHTTLPFFNNPIPTLVHSSAMDNFIDKSLVVLTL